MEWYWIVLICAGAICVYCLLGAIVAAYVHYVVDWPGEWDVIENTAVVMFWPVMLIACGFTLIGTTLFKISNKFFKWITHKGNN